MLNDVPPYSDRSTANGTVTSFAYTFKILAAADIAVYVDLTLKSLGTDYTLTGVGDSGGGTVVFLSAPANNSIVTRLRNQAAAQGSAYTQNEAFPWTRIEQDLDKLVAQVQQAKEQLRRGFFLPVSSSLADQGIDVPVVGSFARGKSGGGIDWATPVLAGALSSPVPIANGGTGATTAAAARAALLLQSTTAQQGIVELATNAEVITGTDTDRASTPAGVAAAIAAALSASAPTTVVAYTTADTLDAGVGLALLSGASFAFTLPAAAGETGREVSIIHQGTSLSDIYTVTGNAAETIIGYDSTGNTFALYTNGEIITLKCDGTHWRVIAHQAKTNWADAGAMTIAGSTSAPTKPTTPDYDHVFWRRDGKQVWVKWLLQISSAAGAADGSGAYLFTTPIGIAIDSASMSFLGAAWATATMSENIRTLVSGFGKIVVDSVQHDVVIPATFNAGATQLQWVRNGGTTPLGSGAYPMSTAEMGYYLEATFQAKNWRV